MKNITPKIIQNLVARLFKNGGSIKIEQNGKSTEIPIAGTFKDRLFKRFVRDSEGNPRGVVIGRLDEINGKNVLKIGWSFVNLKAGDQYDKNRGHKIAMARLDSPTNAIVPWEVNEVIDWIVETVQEYCQNDNFSVSVAGSRTANKPENVGHQFSN